MKIKKAKESIGVTASHSIIKNQFEIEVFSCKEPIMTSEGGLEIYSQATIWDDEIPVYHELYREQLTNSKCAEVAQTFSDNIEMLTKNVE